MKQEIGKSIGRSEHGAPSSRDAFFNALFPLFQQDRNCVLVSADDGGDAVLRFAQEMPRQFFQAGIAEQFAIGFAAGLAREGKRPFVYAIAPFMSTRVHEFVKLDVCAMNLPVVIIGVGAGYSYDIMGPSHHCVEDIALMRVLPNIEIWSPPDAAFAARFADYVYVNRRPIYLRLDRSALPNLGGDYPIYDLNGVVGWAAAGEVYGDASAAVLSTGFMTHEALKVQQILLNSGVCVDLYDVPRLKPFRAYSSEDEVGLLNVVGNKPIITMEEHFLAGGFGSVVAEHLLDGGKTNQLLRLGRSERQGFCLEQYGGRAAIHRETGLDAQGAAARIKEWING